MQITRDVDVRVGYFLVHICSNVASVYSFGTCVLKCHIYMFIQNEGSAACIWNVVAVFVQWYISITWNVVYKVCAQCSRLHSWCQWHVPPIWTHVAYIWNVMDILVSSSICWSWYIDTSVGINAHASCDFMKLAKMPWCVCQEWCCDISNDLTQNQFLMDNHLSDFDQWPM